MILYRNRLIFGIIKRIISTIFKAVYAILSLFNLQLTLLMLAIGAVLYFTGVLTANSTFRLIFNLVLIATVIYAIIATLKKLLGFGKKNSRGKGVQIVKSTQVEPQVVYVQPPVQTVQPPQPQAVQEQNPVVEKPIYPKYFRVKQNPEYVMAEYADKYELFRIINGSLFKVRTDYKR